MSNNNDPSTVEELNAVLRLGRRMAIGMYSIIPIGFVLALILAIVGNQFNKPYGLYIAGEGLGTWGVGFTFIALLLDMYWIAFKLAKALRNPIIFVMPLFGIMLTGTVVTERAKKLNMKPGFFMGPLKPID